MTLRSSITAALAALTLGGCAWLSGPYQQPVAELPPAWQGSAAKEAAWPDRNWWARFGNSELDALIAQAHEGNFDLKAAAARVTQARANARIAGSALWPKLTADASGGRSKSPGGQSAASYQAGLAASYEIDVWGLNRAGADAADYALLSSSYGEEVVRLTLTADLATTYFQLLSLNDRIRVAEDNLANARSLLELIEAQQRAGRVSALEYQRQLTQVANSEAAIPPLLQQRRVVWDALAVLVGSHTAGVRLPAGSLRPVALPEVGVGLPSDLLARRPDIRRAEADLRAAHADVGAARAALLPSFTLGASGGYRNGSLSHLFDSGRGFYSYGLDLLATIFDGGRLLGQIDLAEGRREELVAAYRQSIVSAVRDVEDALAGIEQFAVQEQAQMRALDAAREAYRLAEARYKAGSADFTTVLDAQRTLLAAESALDPVRLARVTATVDLYRALGGGWDAASASGK